ncbi:VCBS repeat-containing protein [Nocardia sp. NPDC046473]|uniref:FG-GAP repeat domain-containing protein n=1 Tax=Nocardia sp. NPDC046473 TaxID=3155733 RepID=UPI0033CD9825
MTLKVGHSWASVMTAVAVVIFVGFVPRPAIAATAGVTFTDITPGSSLSDYRRAPSPAEFARREGNRQRPMSNDADFVAEPVHDRGLPGVVLFDYDNDGDSDIFVTNGPGRPKSLYRNDLQGGHSTFVDVGSAAGVGLTAMDANGACAGDIDNDGNMDLYVLGRNQPNHLMKNLGNGTFQDITDSSNTGLGNLNHTSCTMGDFDNDGLLDIAIANTFPMTDGLAIVGAPYGLTQQNQLLHNIGGSTFVDASASSGFDMIKLQGVAPVPLGDISWAISAVDLDQDGHLDLVVANDQGAFFMNKYGGIDRGFNRVYRNDGTGHFQDVTYEVGLAEPGAWMGLAFGDFNFDGTIDFFSTNFGDYVMMNPPVPIVTQDLGDWSSRWLLQKPDGTFVDPRRSSVRNPVATAADPSLGGLNATPFGWGVSAFDYDNDGSTDIVYHGSLDALSVVTADNPGTLLHNEGPQAMRNGFFPSFTSDDAFTRSGADHRHRTVLGVAVADLDHNGFDDVVSVGSSVNVGDLTPYHDVEQFNFNSPFDDAKFLEVYAPFGGGRRNTVLYTPTGKHTEDGDLVVEMNNGGNGNRSAAVRTVGSIGLTDGARVNRSGIGAVVKFTPAGGTTAIRPVIAGSSFASQDELEGTFGMGHAATAVVDVLWPGGARNKLYDVKPGERITFPEIPCSYADSTISVDQYRACVSKSVSDLSASGQVTQQQGDRLLSSALRAFDEAH